MQIHENTAIQFAAPPPVINEAASNIARCERLASDAALVYWDYPESAQLAFLLDRYRPAIPDADVPSPMLRDYNWPGIYRPLEHQKVTASFLSLRYRAFCFNEAGTGKTSAAVWAADYLMNIGEIKRVLIVCPMTIMYTAWQADIFKTAMHRTAVVAYGTPERRRRAVEGGYEFVIINYDGVNTIRDTLEAANFDLIIVDEANAYKDSATKRWKTLARMLRPSSRLWMMTGTPASQSPLDAFGLSRLVAPQRVPKFKSAWRDKVMTQVGRFTWMPKACAKQEVFNALQPAIRFTKEECIDLPDVVYQTRDIPLTPQVHAYYKRLKSQMLIEAAGEQITAVNAAVNLSKLLQISGGAVYTDDKNVIEFDISPRLAALKEVLDETERKVIVFIPFRHTIELVTEYLRGIDVSTEVIHGDVSPRERSELITRFQSQPEPRVLVIQPQSASHGVTLTEADTVIFWSPVMSVETYLQCIARIDRIGQKYRMTVVHLQGSDVERKVYRMLQNKVDSHQQLVDLYKQELGI